MRKKIAPKLRSGKPTGTTRPHTAVVPPENSFPVVGIGASAGGLEALEKFLRHLPSNSGLAVVIVQHMEPTHKAVLAELLQRATKMKVAEVKDRIRVQPDCVYVIPPNKELSLQQGVLHLLDPVVPHGQRLPIDFFLRSLAQDRQERSIGVILSGMGSDGTLGVRAIKEQAGLVLVQDPATAGFSGMPRSAVDSGLADIVAPVEDLPGKITAYLQRSPLIARKETWPLDELSQAALEKIIGLLHTHTGHDFSMYKQNMLCRRIERRMGIHQFVDMADYARYLQANAPGRDLLFKEILIGVTSFFRDPAVWSHLRDKALPSLIARQLPGRILRAWVPGCSTGEEAYSLAIVFKEMQERDAVPCALQIFATDLDRDAIEKARQGYFPANIAADVSPERLRRFFTREAHGYRVSKEIREMVVFAPQNIILDPPFTKLDILCCRNLLIYLTTEAQKKLIPLFHYCLRPEGVLLLGSAEAIGDYSNLFAVLNNKLRLFRRKEAVSCLAPSDFLISSRAALSSVEGATLPFQLPGSFQALANQLIQQRYAPPAVLVNEDGDICYVSGRTGNYLEPTAGKTNWNVFAMARDGLRGELPGAFRKALQQKASVTLRGLNVGHADGRHFVDVTLQRIDEPGPLLGLILIVFASGAVPVASPAVVRKAGTRVRRLPQTELEQELQRARDEARIRVEEIQTAQEAYRSASEELQSTNEELQSANEELASAKEEMQLLNEELQAKLDEQAQTNRDVKNQLDSIDIAVLFLDKTLHVRRFTPRMTSIIKLIDRDIGRPVTDLVSELDYPALATDVKEVLRTLAVVEKQAATRDGRWFHVRIMPYRTLDDRIDGVVITVAELTERKQ